jgi:hypothetical protein
MLLVDGANVIGSRPNGWWRDRAVAARALVDRLGAAVAAGIFDEQVVIVLEGAARGGVPEGLTEGVQVVHAAASGDDAIVELAGRGSDPVVVVSADRELGRRVERLSARIVGPRWLLAQLPGDAGSTGNAGPGWKTGDS